MNYKQVRNTYFSNQNTTQIVDYGRPIHENILPRKGSHALAAKRGVL